ncbi:V-type ATP synthase subunit F [uncultured Finegoldia sp.]|uniref:V-type ATP synthase subunit F n=1 Tax=uncultured Finegoldia sp. TaxID=328009 RepID=UPI002635990B|nr:V-type ATP synthase subunit F [uncultured Finegoldia sp.]
MKSVIISADNVTNLGMRLAGITGIVAKSEVEMKRAFKAAIVDDTLGVVIITEKVFNTIKDDVTRHKDKAKRPLVVTIPGRNGLEDKDFLMKYIKASIGIKVD